MDDYGSKMRKYSKTKILSYLDVDKEQTADLIEEAIYESSLKKYSNKPFVWDHYSFRQAYKDVLLNTIYTLETMDNLSLKNGFDPEKLLSFINLSPFDKKPKLYSFTEYIEKQEPQEVSQGILKCWCLCSKRTFCIQHFL